LPGAGVKDLEKEGGGKGEKTGINDGMCTALGVQGNDAVRRDITFQK